MQTGLFTVVLAGVRVEVVAIAFNQGMILTGIFGIFLSLAARLAAVAVPIFMLSRWKNTAAM